jgi:hypothetical protein
MGARYRVAAPFDGYLSPGLAPAGDQHRVTVVKARSWPLWRRAVTSTLALHVILMRHTVGADQTNLRICRARSLRFWRACCRIAASIAEGSFRVVDAPVGRAASHGRSVSS